VQCDPYAHDWFSESDIVVFGAELIPDAVYDLHTTDAACNYLVNESCWTLVGAGITTARYGDVTKLFEGDNPTAPQPDFGDIAAVVQKFLAAEGAPIKAVSALEPNVPFPIRPIDFKDIASVVDAFLDTPKYAERFHGPCPCPSWAQCGAASCNRDSDCPRVCEDRMTACVSDADCAGAGLTKCGLAMCVDGACADECARCSE